MPERAKISLRTPALVLVAPCLLAMHCPHAKTAAFGGIALDEDPAVVVIAQTTTDPRGEPGNAVWIRFTPTGELVDGPTSLGQYPMVEFPRPFGRRLLRPLVLREIAPPSRDEGLGLFGMHGEVVAYTEGRRYLMGDWSVGEDAGGEGWSASLRELAEVWGEDDPAPCPLGRQPQRSWALCGAANAPGLLAVTMSVCAGEGAVSAAWLAQRLDPEGALVGEVEHGVIEAQVTSRVQACALADDGAGAFTAWLGEERGSALVLLGAEVPAPEVEGPVQAFAVGQQFAVLGQTEKQAFDDEATLSVFDRQGRALTSMTVEGALAGATLGQELLLVRHTSGNPGSLWFSRFDDRGSSVGEQPVPLDDLVPPARR